MSTRAIEILVGVFVAVGFAALFALAMQVSNLSALNETNGYRITAYFENIGGLKVRSPVTVSGVRVGRVSSIHYNSNQYQAEVVLVIEASQDYFPIDTSASIFTSGLLGEQYIALEPGAEEQLLKNGDTLQYTQSAMILERLISRVLVNLTSE
ncbi:MAG: outer membrane lipid asymmetry maintenance protein MlaD [Gammaproteobacteria bacterium]|nr:outer membrane lipid asymmetry maintenance protein MlaD [Gammaproteobacteria bacterium]